MKKMKMRVAALLGALALTAWGIGMAGCTHDAGLKISDLVGSDMDDGGDGGPGGGNTGGGSGGNLADRRPLTAPSTQGTVTMNNAQYPSLEAAWNAIDSSGDYVITLTEGTYAIPTGNVLSYNGGANITISGKGSAEYGLDVLITGNPGTTSQNARNLVFISGGSANLVLENLTIQNTYMGGQAEALAFDGTGNLAAYNCAFLSHQDTIRTQGKAWFYKCYIEGDVDFVWIEHSGKVALYEECVLRMVNDRTNKGYYAAPRQTRARFAYKGLVIYNSTLEAEVMEVYLGRNIEENKSDEFTNIAVIGSEFYGNLHSNVWYNDVGANGTSDQQYIGFKTDSYFARSAAGYGTILSTQMVSKEYAGRTNIMNRVYDTTAKKFKPEAEVTRWDVNRVATANGWKVTTDSSNYIFADETETESVDSYDLTSEILPAALTITGFSHHTNSDGGRVTGNAGASIVVPVTGKAVVKVRGCYSGNGTIQAGSQGTALYDFNNNSTNKIIEKLYVVYDANATSVTITATSTTYITEIEVEYDDDLYFVPVRTIAVSSADNATQVKAKKTLQFTAALTPIDPTNSDVMWEITEGGSAATIDQTGLLTALAPTVDTPVTVKVMSLDANGASATKSITVLKLNEDTGSISWAPDNATDVSLEADNGDAKDFATGNNFSMYWADETTPIAESSLMIGSGRNHTSVGYSKEGVDFKTGGTILTYHFPVTAGSSAITLTNFAYKFGYSATNNINGTVSVIDSGGTSVYIGDPLKSGSTDGHANDGIVASEELAVVVAANQTVTVVVTITPTNDLTTKTNAFIIADVVLDFEK